MMTELTNDAKYLLSSLYSKYLERRSDGKHKIHAISFGNVGEIHKTIMPEWSFEDVNFTCFELKKHGYIKGNAASNSLFNISITTEAIAELESTFKDKVDSVLEYATKIKNLIPFV